jgi:hypothetical protein
MKLTTSPDIGDGFASGGRPSDSVAERGILQIVHPERENLSGT